MEFFIITILYHLFSTLFHNPLDCDRQNGYGYGYVCITYSFMVEDLMLFLRSSTIIFINFPQFVSPNRNVLGALIFYSLASFLNVSINNCCCSCCRHLVKAVATTRMRTGG